MISLLSQFHYWYQFEGCCKVLMLGILWHFQGVARVVHTGEAARVEALQTIH